MEKRRNCSLGAISLPFHNIFYMLLDFHIEAGTRFSLRDNRLFEINEVEIARVNCKYQCVYMRNKFMFFNKHIGKNAKSLRKLHNGYRNSISTYRFNTLWSLDSRTYMLFVCHPIFSTGFLGNGCFVPEHARHPKVIRHVLVIPWFVRMYDEIRHEHEQVQVTHTCAEPWYN